ncbi:hypothetical protein Slin15195_G063690 [Septoria linicola]|uniref:Uncharacterized protein n=1 Tax=Septoria linicola TaxID=215465 RepID=A0A9Q9AV15_9PEZI|nr:hypothetical protein Slin14017_G114000 [Septoria linicola]USW53050.1 hypothetical protein Slin15195_G063690 [Septoria linicola]
MTDVGYFPSIDEYQAKISKKRCAPAPLLPTPSTQGTFLPVFGVEVEASKSTPGMNEPVPCQACSCPISDACILETFAFLHGSMNLLREIYEWQEFGDAKLGEIVANPCQLATIIRDLLPSTRKRDAPEAAASASLLLRRDSFLPTPEDSDVCSYVRQRLEDLMLDSVDTFAPIQHRIHVILAIMGFDSAEFRAHLRHRKLVQESDEVDLMCQAYDHLARSSPKVYSSQFAEQVQALRAAIEAISYQIAFEVDVRSSSTGEIVESVAAEKRFSCTTAKLISIPRLTACV